MQKNISTIETSGLKIPTYTLQFVVGSEDTVSTRVLQSKVKEITRSLQYIIEKDNGVVLEVKQIPIRNFYLSDIFTSATNICSLNIIVSTALLNELQYFVKNHKDVIHYTIFK